MNGKFLLSMESPNFITHRTLHVTKIRMMNCPQIPSNRRFQSLKNAWESHKDSNVSIAIYFVKTHT